MFEKVQQIRQQRHHRTKTGKSSIFSGLVYCADCGAKMYYCTSSKFEKRQDFFVCSTYRHHKDQCSAHYIRAVALEDMVLRHMQMVISYVANHEAHFREVMRGKLKVESEEIIQVSKKKLAKAERRLGDLDRIFKRLYEDRVNGTISNERFASMSTGPRKTDSRQKAPCCRRITTTGGIVMGERKYTHVKELEPVILQMRKEGKTRREIAEHLGLTKRQVEQWVTRYNRRQRKLAAGIAPRPKGGPRRKPLSREEEYEKEIARLQMENQLLRDFLQFTERM